jgi:hypothetical protein
LVRTFIEDVDHEDGQDSQYLIPADNFSTLQLFDFKNVMKNPEVENGSYFRVLKFLEDCDKYLIQWNEQPRLTNITILHCIDIYAEKYGVGIDKKYKVAAENGRKLEVLYRYLTPDLAHLSVKDFDGEDVYDNIF